MLPFKIIFQCLDGKYFLQYFNGVSAIYMEKFYDFTASDLWQLSVKYTCQELTLLHFARFCVLIFIKYSKVIHKQAFRLGCKNTFTNKQF